MSLKLPRHVIKTKVFRSSVVAAHYSCCAMVELPERILASCEFTGRDGRETRNRAILWAHGEAEKHAQALGTAWRDVQDSARFPWAPATP